MTKIIPSVLVAVLLMATAVTADEFTVSAKTTSRLPTSEMAMYSCVFTNQWTAANHPNLYPTGMAHWSPPVVATHDMTYEMWSDGSIASMGVELVAETGETSILESELEIDAVMSITVGEVQFNKDTPSQTIMDIAVNEDHPMISAITMISPSPDWFSGFYNFDARNVATQTWLKSFTITTYPWDAGTEQGSRYSPDNSAQSPKAPIKQLTADTVPSTGVFLNTTSMTTGPKTVKPVATWMCTIESDPVCKAQGNACASGIQCCSSRCVNDVCLAARPTDGRSSLGSRGGLGGSASRPITVSTAGGGRGGTGGTAGRPINVSQGRGGRE